LQANAVGVAWRRGAGAGASKTKPMDVDDKSVDEPVSAQKKTPTVMRRGGRRAVTASRK